MNITKAEFISTCYQLSDLPSENYPEVAFIGRSNVGKSSLINTLTGRKKLARISNKPGKTQAITLFNIEDLFYLVDLPGYGFAKVSKQMKNNWKDLIEGYLSNRTTLKLCVQIIDARNGPTDSDKLMLDWLVDRERTVLVVATKFDKLKNKDKKTRLMEMKRDLDFGDDDLLLPFSSETNQGKDELLEIINDIISG